MSGPDSLQAEINALERTYARLKTQYGDTPAMAGQLEDLEQRILAAKIKLKNTLVGESAPQGEAEAQAMGKTLKRGI